MDGGDAYFGKIFGDKTQSEIYNRYLDLLLASVKVPYDYDIVGHVGYVTRYVSFENYTLWQEEYKEKIDELLNEIIARDKTIEINTHIKHKEMFFLMEQTFHLFQTKFHYFHPFFVNFQQNISKKFLLVVWIRHHF